ncbi:MAG TPA: flagellin, partial [Candidatus Limenecus avicola]|nr:flagellin [Candidatus Limenecus avicola]
TLELQTTQIENLTASVSTIMDADIAQESAEYVKNRILTQTAAALLSVSSSHRSNLLLSLING